MVRDFLSRHKYGLSFLSIALIYTCNSFLDVMDVDAAQYASISLEMLQSGSYLEVYDRGNDYLDKPPLLFWLSSLSFKYLGVCNLTYKLPSLVMLCLGIFATYRFTQLWYDKQRALIAALVLASTQACMLMTNDVRTDGMLTGFVILAVWQIILFLRDSRFLHLCIAALCLAGALMTKGPLGLIIVCFAVGGDLIIKGQWKDFIKVQWIWLGLIVAVLLLPMCYGLYMQYDLHPEKVVYGLQGPSGLRFFFWTQSFGRITGEIYWDNGLGPFFFFHSILWDLQPWTVFLLPALYFKIKKLLALKSQNLSQIEFISFFGFVLSFMALSASRFKLPHYIFPLFPFLAILLADYLDQLSLVLTKFNTTLLNIHFGLMNIFFVLIGINFVYFFPTDNCFLPLLCILFYGLFWYTFLESTDRISKVLMPTVIVVFVLGLVMSTHLYPSLLKYQTSNDLGKEITIQKVPQDKFYCFRAYARSLDFYARRIVPTADIRKLQNYPLGTLIYTDQKGWEEIRHCKNNTYQIAKE